MKQTAGAEKKSLRSSQEFVASYREEAIRLLKEVSVDQVAGFVDDLWVCGVEDRRIFACGNGGSASAASHFAADLGKMAAIPSGGRFRVYSLVDNIAWATAVANDIAFEAVFVEQLSNLARSGDRLVAFSTSGRSANVLRAVEWGNQNGLVTWALTGGQSSPLGDIAQRRCSVPGSHTGHVEEAHLLIHHIASYFFARIK